MSRKWVYAFAEGNAEMRDLLGGKGANLAEMARLGFSVPPGFTITTEACNAFLAAGETFPDGLWDQVLAAMKALENGKRFGDPDRPLLVSVRSGARFSMPGMMDTVLNLGLNRETTGALARLTENPRFAHDSMRRLLQLFGKVVMGVPGERFQEALDDRCARQGVKNEGALTAQDFEELCRVFRDIIQEETGREFPEDPYQQLEMAIAAVFQSWNGRRARDYRRIHQIPDDLGTAVNVQTMVFGNMGEDSGTGVAFTRNPATGEKGLFGEYLLNAQGEDVVAGTRTPHPIQTLADDMPEVHAQLTDHARRLERHFRDMQDMEFTIENAHLYLLQTRVGKRTATAAVKIAVDMVEEKLITSDEAVLRVDAGALDQLLHPGIDPDADATPLTTGLPASPGAAGGEIILDPDEAEQAAKEGRQVILVRVETAPEDFHGMVAAAGILTARGGMTSHAAVVARGMGKCCICGAGDLTVDYQQGTIAVGDKVLRKGEWITLDGSTGTVYEGRIPTREPELEGEFKKLMEWADAVRKTGVRTNADTPESAAKARQFGAEGIGLCRTEHMFFEGDRILRMRQMILSDTVEEREEALALLEPHQEQDFFEIFRAMDGFPVTIRTLDPPLHEFLPHEDPEIRELARELKISEEAIRARISRLREANPMIGFRGCRLGIIYPEITAMQARAIIRAAIRARREGIAVEPEIMIPLVSEFNEFAAQAAVVRREAARVMEKEGMEVAYKVGTMIEIPRAALLAHEIAEEAEFFSFGTNDLTQMTFGLSRDDAGSFLPAYLHDRILKTDPFQVLDQKGVGQLVRLGVSGGRRSRPGMKIGICGEHGGEPSSVKFCVREGLDYVSCSPYRVPIARLAAAQADLEASREQA